MTSKVQSIYIAETPAEIAQAKGLHLITHSTPNGQRVQIFLEELKATYGLEYTTSVIDLSTNVQKSDWFLSLNPNGRIPVLIDNSLEKPFTVMETSAILLYLATKYDTNKVFGFEDELEWNEAVQWLFFTHGGIGPMMGQMFHFKYAAKEKIPYAVQRYDEESLRLLGVLEIQLSGKFTGQEKDFIAGNDRGKYSFADICIWPWVNAHEKLNLDMSKFPHLLKYIERIKLRPSATAGLSDAYSLKK